MNKFSIQQREEGKRIVKRAINRGLIDKPLKCGVCNQTEGIIEYYISDFRPQYILRGVRPLCWTCHRMLILKNRFKEQSNNYFKEIRMGKKFKPVYEDDINILSNYGIGSLYIEMYGVDNL